MKIKSTPGFLLLLAALASLPATAQDSDADAAEPVPRYDVEIVVFKNVQVPSSREFALPVTAPARDERMLDLSSPESVTAAAEFDYRILPSDEFRLIDEVARLVESPRYELLLHIAWRQPGLELGETMPIWIRGGRIFGQEYQSIDSRPGSLGGPAGSDATVGDQSTYSFDAQSLDSLQQQLLDRQGQSSHRGLYEFEGKITVALSRYLHTYVDLVLRRPRLVADELPSNPIQEQYLATRAADTRILNNHRLREHRRMRSKNLHYLDNPEFALLILITPYEAPEDADAVPAAATAGTSG